MRVLLCVALLVVLFLGYVNVAVDAQLSARNAATFILLRSVDADEGLRETFYNAPANTTMTVSVDGYEVLAESRNSAPAQSAYASSMFYRGKRGVTPRPYQVRLSDEWLLLEKPLAAQRETVTYREENEARDSSGAPEGLAKSEAVALLHCRLPLPRSDEELHDAEVAFLREEGPRMQDALEEWWLRLGTTEQERRCLYGDGESGTTRVHRYYSLCPRGRTTRVRHYELERILSSQNRRSSSDARPVDGEGKRDGKSGANGSRDDNRIIDFLRAKDREHALSDIASDPVFATAFEVIGEYHPAISRPQWNPTEGAWEVHYPSTSPCATHIASEAAPKPFVPPGWMRYTPTSVGPHDPFWKTVVRFRCSDTGTIKGDAFGSVGYWAITDMRQTCTYQMEITTPVVCGWEQELDRLRVSAIPCVVLSDDGGV